jgi:negative regulator of genetic competence, sporulation and motility
MDNIFLSVENLTTTQRPSQNNQADKHPNFISSNINNNRNTNENIDTTEENEYISIVLKFSIIIHVLFSIVTNHHHRYINLLYKYVHSCCLQLYQ